MKIPEYIKAKRRQLRETQGQFGKRFGVSYATISAWESGKAEAPYMVIEFCLEILRLVECPICKGKGVLS